MRAYAICAFPIDGLQRFVAESEADSRANDAIAHCPPGKEVVGTGADITGGLGEVGLRHVTPRSNRVDVAAHEDADGADATWWVRAYAICALPIDGLRRVPAVSGVLDSRSPKSATASCPEGKKVVGTGGEIDIYGNDDVSAAKGQVLDDLRPESGLSGVTVTGYAGQGAIGEWRAVAFAVCAPPGTIGPAPPPAPDLENAGP